MSLDGGVELRHLRYFVAVAETLHFSRAAAQLHLTQPALSRQIRDLEAEIGAVLLHRHGTQTTLTPVGARFRERAKELLAAADRAVEEARTASRTLRFGHYGTLWVDYFAPVLRSFAKRHRQVTLQAVELTPVGLVAALRRGEIDVALVGQADAALRREFATRPLGRVEMMLALGADNPLAKRRRYALAELKDAAWVIWDERDFPGRRQLLCDAAKTAGFKPRVVETVDSLASMFVAVATSPAIGYVLPMSRKLPHAGVAFAGLKPPGVFFEMHAAWRRDTAKVAEIEALTEAMAATRAPV